MLRVVSTLGYSHRGADDESLAAEVARPTFSSCGLPDPLPDWLHASKVLIVAGADAGILLRALFEPEVKSAAHREFSGKDGLHLSRLGDGVVLCAFSSRVEAASAAMTLRSLVDVAAPASVIALDLTAVGELATSETVITRYLASADVAALIGDALQPLAPPEMIEGVAGEALAAALDASKHAAAVRIVARATEASSSTVAAQAASALRALAHRVAAFAALRTLPGLGAADGASSPAPGAADGAAAHAGAGAGAAGASAAAKDWAARVARAGRALGATTERIAVASMFA